MKVITKLALCSCVILPFIPNIGMAQNSIAHNMLSYNTVALNESEHNAMNKDEEASDDVIVSQIKDKIEEDPLLKTLKVEVQSKKGEVELVGLVNTKMQAEKIATFAESTVGVKDVETKNLKVKDSKAPLYDTYITAKIKGLLIRNNILDLGGQGDISVETKDGVVHLSGTVNDRSQHDQVVTMIKTIKGVKKIEESLKIKNQ